MKFTIFIYYFIIHGGTFVENYIDSFIDLKDQNAITIELEAQ